MPEGDTVHRAARRLAAVLDDSVLTAAVTPRGIPADRLTGQTVQRVEACGKHLLMWLEPSGLVLHSHLGMTGSWHIHRHGQAWGRPAHRATVRLETAEHVVVGFTIPTLELLAGARLAQHPVLARLGPDGVRADVDLGVARSRLDAVPERAIAESLLDQAVLAGVGNVYKSEVLFLHGVQPWTRVADVPGEVRDGLLATAARLLRENTEAEHGGRVTTGDGAGGRLWVYGRAGRPCRRCGTPVRVRRQGEHARSTYWCPTCQPPPTRPQ